MRMDEDENTDCSNKQHVEGGFHSVIGEDNDKGDIENQDDGKRKRKKDGEEKERGPKQLQFSRLMERFSDMWANSPFSYEAERERIEAIRAERGRRRPPSPPKRFSDRRVDIDKTEEDKSEDLATEQQQLLQIKQQQEAARQQQLFRSQQQHLRRLLFLQQQQVLLKQQQAESQQHNQWLF